MEEQNNSNHSNEEIYQLTLENNKILRSLRRHQRIGVFFSILYWVIVIGSLAGAYYYVRPVVTAFTGNNAQVQNTLDEFDAFRAQFPEAKLFDSFLKKIRGATTTENQTN